MSVKIIVDSTADLIESVKERVTIVPLTIRFGDEEFIDGVTITHKKFYEKLVESDVLPTTSQATPDNFEQVYRQVKQNGDSAVVITVASKLSGTYQSAIIAAEDYDNIYVVDSKTVAIASGILVDYALRLVDAGMTAEDIAKELELAREDIRLVALVDTLEYLKKGGRISKTVAFAGGLLSIKPVISVEDGEIKMLGTARGSKQANNRLVTEIQETGGVNFNRPILLGYTGLSDALLQKYIEDSAHLWQNNVQKLDTTIVGSVVGTHAGPGAVAVAFFKA